MATIAETLNLAVEHHRQGRFAQAEQLYRQVLLADRQNIDALHLFGLLASQVGNYDVAVEYIGRAIRLHNREAAFYVNLGEAYRKWGKADEALAALEKAVALDPKLSEAHNTLGAVLQSQGRLDDALAAYTRAIELAPDFGQAHANIGPLLVERGEHEGAMRHFDHALRVDPGLTAAHVNRGVALLLFGDFAEGWREFEWRLKLPDAAKRPWSQPLWDGSPLEGRTIVLCPDHGLGDALQFIRYAPSVKERGASVVVFCHEKLIPILSTCAGVDRCVSNAALLPPFDVYAPLLSLPGIFGTSLETIPNRAAYLSADSALVEHWRRELQAGGRTNSARSASSSLRPPASSLFKIGINWQGNPSYPSDSARSFRLAEFAPLTAIDGVRLLSLQKGPGAEQLAEAAFAVEELGSQLDEGSAAFRDTAAVIENLDLVITSDTAVAHLAGALGAKVWVALSHTPDWRWLLGRGDSPWYPTMRLFRQSQPGDWSGVFAKMAADLSAMVGH